LHLDSFVDIIASINAYRKLKSLHISSIQLNCRVDLSRHVRGSALV